MSKDTACDWRWIRKDKLQPACFEVLLVCEIWWWRPIRTSTEKLQRMSLMKEPYVIGIRVAGACWGLLELAGFLWFYSAARGAGLNFYWLSPALALLALSMAPGFVTHRPVGNLLLGTLAI